MTAMYFVWLGSGRAKRRHVDLEGQRLDLAAKAGLPVAPGAILLDDFYRICLEKALLEVSGGRVNIPDAELLHGTLFHSVRLPRFERPVGISLIPTDMDEVQEPDKPRHRYIIDADRPDELARALVTTWNAAAHRPAEARRDLLLMEEYAAEQNGRAFISDELGEDRVEYSDGGTRGLTLALPVLTGWRKPGENLPPFARRLQMLLRGVRRTFGPGKWVVEWADDGRICRLTRIIASGSPARS